MRYPDFLKENGTIGFVAPSFGCSFDPYLSCFNRAQDVLKDNGYSLKLGPNCYKSDGIGISTKPYDCARELAEVYSENDNDVMISCGGGELMCETISYVDFDLIKNSKPKWYMGYSDNTNLTFLLTTLCDVASIYGPCISSFGMNPWHASLQKSLDILNGKSLIVNSFDKYEKESLKDEEHPFEPYNLTERTCIRGFVPDNEHNDIVNSSSDKNSKYSNLSVDEGLEKNKYSSMSEGLDKNKYSSMNEGLDKNKYSSMSEGLEKNKYSSMNEGLDKNKYSSMSEGLDKNVYSSMEESLKEVSELSIEGRLIGGCMDCLVNILGTRFDKVSDFLEKYKDDGFVWFLEACDLNVFSIRRAMWQMKEAGWFKYVKGFIFGRPLNGEDMFNLDHYEAVLSTVYELAVPAILDADIGHVAPMMPMICGAVGDVKFDDGRLSVEFVME